MKFRLLPVSIYRKLFKRNRFKLPRRPAEEFGPSAGRHAGLAQPCPGTENPAAARGWHLPGAHHLRPAFSTAPRSAS